MGSNGSKKPNIKDLRELYESSQAAKAALDYFAARQYNTRRTTVDRVHRVFRRDGYDVSRSQIIDLFKRLESAGCGQFVVGRKGHASRFEWSASLISTGQAASGETSNVEQLSETEAASVKEEESGAELIEHRYVLRPDVELTISLPADLTPAEANRVADYVRTLPFGG